MAATKSHAFFLLSVFSTLSFIINSSNAAECVGSGVISVYWGQHTEAEEGSLQQLCDSGRYNIAILESLIVYDSGRDPTLNLDDHCGSVEYPCTRLEGQIKHCQELGIKVFLSIGADQPQFKTGHHRSIPSSSSSSSDDEDVTQALADYIVDKFLSGNLGPLGSVTLDGIDIADVADSEHLHWDKLVQFLKDLTNGAVYLSAAPQCVYPDYYLNTAIKTGLFDYIWVEFFYQNPCIFSASNPNGFWDAWDTWASKVPNSLIFLGLTAYKDIAGYIPPETLISDVLPRARESSNYGGVMIWDRYSDKQNDYSGQIKDSVGKICKCVCDDNGPQPTGFFRTLARNFPM